MTRTEMLDTLIRKYGFENRMTIAFGILAENTKLTDAYIAEIFDCFMKNPFDEDEE